MFWLLCAVTRLLHHCSFAEIGQRACVQRAKEIFKHSKQAAALVIKSQLGGEATTLVPRAQWWQGACWLAAVRPQAGYGELLLVTHLVGWSGCSC